MTITMAPELVARLDTGPDDAPIYVDAHGLRHYKVILEVRNAPEDAYAATFELDQTYYDPYRTVRRDKDGAFRLETTSYGDYDVRVRLRTRDGEVNVHRTLTDALRSAVTTATSPAPAIAEAISDIASR